MQLARGAVSGRLDDRSFSKRTGRASCDVKPAQKTITQQKSFTFSGLSQKAVRERPGPPGWKQIATKLSD